jgi:hypothetical protein
MKIIAVLCLILAVAFANEKAEEVEVVYGIFRKDCWESLIVRQDFSSTENVKSCAEFALIKWAGISIIVGALFFKLPQVSKILKSGSVEGISA